MSQPSIGRIVHYRLTKDQAEAINQRYEHAADRRQVMQDLKFGFQAHVGNRPLEGDIVAMVVTAVWGPEMVNGQCLLDGTDSMWVTSAHAGDGPGTWSWPPRV